MMALWNVLDQKSVAYASTSLGATLMHSVFNFYYVKIYLNLFHVSESWFQGSQVVFMIWNAINDPLFGYIQDNYSFSWVKSRRHSILYGAPLFVISFMVTWIPWGSYTESTESWLAGAQLMFSLCFYDTLFTFVLLAQCALFTEMSKLQHDRLRLVRYSQIGSLIGSSSVFFTNLVSANAENFFLFQLMCAIITGIAYLCFAYTGRHALTEYEELQIEEHKLLGVDVNLPLDKTSQFTMKQQVFQIFSQPSFVSFVLMNFCQIYHSTFLANFISIMCDAMISKEVMSASVRSVFYGTVFTIPQIMLIAGTPIISRVGYYRCISFSFGLKIFMGMLLYLMGPQTATLILFYIADSAGVFATFGLFNLCLSDVIDVDKDTHHRRHPLSSMVFGLNALVTKPAISFAPMISVAILNRYGYGDYKAAMKDTGSGSAVASQELLSAMFYMTCVTPIIIGLIQIVIWSRYTIRNSHMTVSKYVEGTD